MALFVTVSSQTDKTPSNSNTQKEANIQDATKPYYDLLAHSKDKIVIPTQG